MKDGFNEITETASDIQASLDDANMGKRLSILLQNAIDNNADDKEFCKNAQTLTLDIVTSNYAAIEGQVLFFQKYLENAWPDDIMFHYDCNTIAMLYQGSTTMDLSYIYREDIYDNMNAKLKVGCFTDIFKNAQKSVEELLECTDKAKRNTIQERLSSQLKDLNFMLQDKGIQNVLEGSKNINISHLKELVDTLKSFDFISDSILNGENITPNEREVLNFIENVENLDKQLNQEFVNNKTNDIENENPDNR